MELLRLRGGSATDDAARWGIRLLDQKLVGVVGDALIKERISACYASKVGSGSGKWGARIRKSALWRVLAADAWLTLGKPQQAKLCLDDADAKYGELAWKDGLQSWENAGAFLAGLRNEVTMSLYPESAIEGSGMLSGGEIETEIGEETSGFSSQPQRKSVIGVQVPVLPDEIEEENSTLSPQLEFE
jgi:hypothetical protein